MSYCNLPERIVGPYNQTMFLGCTVTSFNCNLGWGADQSTLTVSLTEDPCFHPQSSEYGATDTKLDQITQQDDNIQGGTAFHKNANGYVYEDPTKALHKNMANELKSLEDTRDNQNIKLSNDFKDYGKACYNSNGNIVRFTDPDPGFLGLQNKFNPRASGYDILGTPVRFKFNNFTFAGLVSSWKQNGSQGGNRQYEVEIKSFANLLNGSQLIIGAYAGTICGILPGTEGSDVNNTRNITGKPIAMPVPYGVDYSQGGTPIFSFNDHRASIQQGNLPNVVNVYGYLEYLGLKNNNIYGNARLNENGMKASFIYDAINFLLGVPSAGSTSSNHFSPYGGLLCRSITENGTVNSVDPKGTTISSGNSTVDLTHMGVCHVGNDPLVAGLKKTRFLLDISEVPRPPRWYRIQGPVISIMQFITELCDGFGFDFFVDFIPANTSLEGQNYSGIIKIRTVSRRTQPKKDNIARLIEYLTKTEENRTSAQIAAEIAAANAQRQVAINNINNLQQQLDNLNTRNGNVGYITDDWRIEGSKAYQDVLDNGGNIQDAIKALEGAYGAGAGIETERKDLAKQIDDAKLELSKQESEVNRLISTGNGANSYMYGKEFTDSNTRAMYIGGKQKRLLQLKSTRLAYKQSTLIYNPFANNGGGAFINYDQNVNPATAYNQVRFPNVFSTRRYFFKIYGGSAVISNSLDYFTRTNFVSSNESLPIDKGNYLNAVNLRNEAFIGTIGNIGANIALMQDTICPYFGVGSNGLIRPVYFDKQMGQIQILFNIMDIQHLTSLPLASYNPYTAAGTNQAGTVSSPIFLVLENEIRAAGGGFKSWLTYCFSNVFTTDIAELIYKGFRDKYGFGSIPKGSPAMFNTPKTDFIAGISMIIAIANNKNVDARGRPQQVNTDMLNPYFKTLYHDLSNIHQFFQNIATEYYGKQFMIQIPEIAWYRDYEYAVDNNNRLINLGLDDSGNTIYAIEGTGKVYTNYQISTDGAWEEPGNFIDDTLVVGGARATFFADETGKIPTILGFNATVEKDYSRKWKRKKFLDYISRYTNYEGFSVGNYEFALERMLNDPDLQDMNHYHLNLEHSLSAEEYMLVPYNNNVIPITMAHGEIAPTNGFFANDKTLGRHKLYVKSSVSEEIQFLGVNNTNPRAIISISSPVFIGSGKNTSEKITMGAMIQDGLLRLTRGSSVPVFLKSQQIGPRNFTAAGDVTVVGGLGPNWWVDPVVGSTIMRNVLEYTHAHECTTSNNLDGTEGSIHPDAIDMLGKTAVPMFCALPLEFNNFIYGPWINHPGLIQNVIFPDTNMSAVQAKEVENLIGGVKVQVDESLVPWNYGGMTALDEAVMNKIADDVNYQQTLETGTVQLPTFDNFNLGDMLKFYAGLFNGPIINSIQVQVGQGGVNATLNFRTYIRKLGLFNKENAERIKAINQEALKRNKELTNKLIQLISKLGAGSFIRLF